jgi:hypothetical protein
MVGWLFDGSLRNLAAKTRQISGIYACENNISTRIKTLRCDSMCAAELR